MQLELCHFDNNQGMGESLIDLIGLIDPRHPKVRSLDTILTWKAGRYHPIDESGAFEDQECSKYVQKLSPS